jgi:2-polyprenyl-3-methyl-5-hydroxy-6-metoxy-1,4-benzoquinol methylase
MSKRDTFTPTEKIPAMTNVVLNEYHFYELANKPSMEELKDYYAKKYYQENKGSYEIQYTDEELLYFRNKIEQKYIVLERLLTPSQRTPELLDIGCGEGFTLHFFKEKKWNVKGIDFSDYGCKKFNPDCLPTLLIGDIYEQMLLLTKADSKYDVIWLDNVLEHVLDPLHLLQACKKLLHSGGVVIIEVPNDFSVLQEHLLNRGDIISRFWVVVPDHISYFNQEGLTALAKDAGLETVFTMGDFPIDFNLINPDTNYNRDKTKGKNTHRSRVSLDNLMHSISAEKTVNYYKALADLGLGRQIISFLKHQ